MPAPQDVSHHVAQLRAHSLLAATPSYKAFILHIAGAHACSAGLACCYGLMLCPCYQCLSLAVCSESVQFRTMGPSEMTSAGELHVFQGNLYTANDVSCST